jgi:UDPglucose 6-dehydrogenase
VAKIGMFGAGYVGLVTGACFADLGHEVVIRDVIPERIELLRAGEVPIYEPGLELVLERNKERMHFTLDIAEAVDGADFLYVAVGTPPTESGDADLAAVWSVIDELPADLPSRPVIVMKSTVPVGTGLHVRSRLDQRGLQGIGYVSNPEFLAEGSAVADFMSPDRIVVGAFEDADGDRVVELHGAIKTEFVRTDVPSAELVKLAANAFLSTRISFINEIANVCELVGADVVDVARGVGLDHRLGSHFLRAGVGFGGSCFPKDVTALKQLAGNSGYPFLLLQAVWEVNELQKKRVVSKLQKHLGSLRGKKIALLGLAFKPNTDDMREAPSRVIAYRLLSEGAEVRAWDPVARPGDLRGIDVVDTVAEAVRDADAAVIVTEWPELRSIITSEIRDSMARPVLIDGRNLLDPVTARDAGFVYEGIGRPRHASPAEPTLRTPELQH